LSPEPLGCGTPDGAAAADAEPGWLGVLLVDVVGVHNDPTGMFDE
jgi:hypothetical protein